MPSSSDALPRWARAADLVALVLLIFAQIVAMTGGFAITLAGLRISVKSEWRLVTWAVGLLLVRHLIVRTPNTYRWIVDAIARRAREDGPLEEEDVFDNRDRQETGRPRTFVHSLGLTVLVIALYAALTAVMTYPQVLHLGQSVSFDEGDALFSTWRLAWVAHQLPRDPLHLFDANIFYPSKHALAYSDAMITTALMAAPLAWMGVHQLAVYNLTFLSGFALSGAAMFLLVRSLTRHTGAALLAGFVFAFLPYRYMHYAHLEMQMAQWVPLCLWAFHRTIKRARLGDGLLTGLFLALQTLSSLYYGIFLATFLVPVALVQLISAGRARFIAVLRPLIAGAFLASLLVLPATLPHFAARQTVGERPQSDIEFYSATPENYIAAHPRNRVFGSLTAKWGGQERELFLGFIVPLVALIGLWPPLSTVRLAYLLGGILAFELSLGFNGVLYRWLHEYALPYRGLRVPARMAIFVGFSMAVLCGFGVARISSRLPGRRGVAATVAVLGALMFFEYQSKLTLKQIWRSPPSIYQQLPDPERTVVLQLPLVRPDIAIEPYFMYFSTFFWYRMVNGYSGFSPPAYQQLVDAIERFPDEDSIAELRRREVGYVIVNAAFYRKEQYERLVESLDKCADLERIAIERWQNHQTRLYRLLPRERAASSGVS